MTGETTKPPVSPASAGEEKSNGKSEKTQVQKPPSTGEDKTMDKSKSAAPTLKTEEVKPHDVPSKKDVEEAKKSAIDAPKTAEAKKEESLPTPTKKLNLKALIKEHLLVKYEVKPDEMFQMDYEAAELYELLDLAKKAFMKEKTLIEVAVPINICGDTHGQFADVRQIFTACGLPFKSRYLFLGDYVDRGMNSLEVIVLLFACKIRFPRNVYLLRGNHELRNINKVYGFHADLRERYRQNNEFEKLYKKFNEVFSYMPLAAIVSGRILCMHGGLSPYLNSLDDIRNIQRPLGKPVGLAQDLLWADPEKGVTKMFDGAKGFEPNKLRAVSFIFGEVAVEEKCKKLGIEMVIRAHQVVEYGYAFFANRKVITVFSASEYDTNLHNFGGVVQVDKQLEIRFVQINARDYRPNSLRTEVDDNQNEEEHPRTGDVPEDEDAGGNTVRTDIK